MKYLPILSLLLISVEFFLPASTNIIISSNLLRLSIFIVSGFCIGTFYGKNDHRVWQFPYGDDFYKKNLEKAYGVKKEIWFKEVPLLNDNAKIHNLWVHIIGGTVGGIALYFLSPHINFNDPNDTLGKLGLLDLTLFLVAILGYSGYIPRTLWFIANKGGMDIKL